MKRKREHDVDLVKTPERWASLPERLRGELVMSVKRIARIRHKIAASAKVRSMPPVKIVDELWVLEDPPGSIKGKQGWVKVGQETCAGVELPAQTAVCDRDDAIRAVLVHKFAHCFDLLVQAVDQLDTGGAIRLQRSSSACRTGMGTASRPPSSWPRVSTSCGLVARRGADGRDRETRRQLRAPEAPRRQRDGNFPADEGV